MHISLKTNRLQLCTLDKSAAQLFIDYRANNYDFFKPTSPTYPDNLLSPEFAENLLDNFKTDTIRLFLFDINDAEKTRILGDITYSNVQYGIACYCNVGYKIDQHIQSKGLMTEALRCANEYIFSVRQLHRIEANIMPDNLASIQVVKKLGFREEGIAYKLLKINGVWEDHLRFSLINEQIL